MPEAVFARPLPPSPTPAPPLYCGRFAPTPSGPLHLGSLVTALASWMAARQAGGRWLLRIDDLDRPRCVPGATDQILRQLEAHGLYWDAEPDYQSAHEEEYRAALDHLQREGALYACRCTRATLALTALPGPDGPIYAGSCRDLALERAASALRYRCTEMAVEWIDGLCGPIRRQIPDEAGDFVVRRADGQIGYHLACVLDEQRLGISTVLRGDDLLGSTAHQLLLMDRLGFARPQYAHLPVLRDDEGRKLSKQNGAPALQTDLRAVRHQLLRALAALGLSLPTGLLPSSPAGLLLEATARWSPQLLAARRAHDLTP